MKKGLGAQALAEIAHHAGWAATVENYAERIELGLILLEWVTTVYHPTGIRVCAFSSAEISQALERLSCCKRYPEISDTLDEMLVQFGEHYHLAFGTPASEIARLTPLAREFWTGLGKYLESRVRPAAPNATPAPESQAAVATTGS